MHFIQECFILLKKNKTSAFGLFDFMRDNSVVEKKRRPYIRIDDIGASSKQYEQHGKKWFRFSNGFPYFYVPFANALFFKRIWPCKAWGPYQELTASEWEKFLSVFDQYGIKPIVAITATWVSENGNSIPFPQMFPEEAAVLKKALKEGLVTIANHGLTHCVVGKHLPLRWESNRQFHREFLSSLPLQRHREHLLKSQEILETYFESPITILVPPGNLWSKHTADAMLQTNLRTVLCGRNMIEQESSLPDGIKFIHDKEDYICFHDRELKLYGIRWLEKLIQKNYA